MSVESVAITGYYGRDNVGDEVLLSSLIDLVNEQYGDIEIFVLTKDVERTEALHDVTAVAESDPLEWVRTSTRADTIIIGGGGLFANSVHLRYPILILINIILNNSIWVVGVSVAPIKNTYDKTLLRLSLSVVDSIVVRDSESKNYLREIGVSRRIDVLPDLAFASKGSSTTAVSHETPEEFIAVSVRPPTGYSRSNLNTGELAQSLDVLKTSLDTEIVFLPFRPDVDAEMSRQVASEMEHFARVIEDPGDFREVESILSEADLLVGMRLHSVILAARNRVPFVGLSYHPKCESVLQQLGTDNIIWCDSFCENELTARVEERYQSEVPDPEDQDLAAAASKSVKRASKSDHEPSYSDKLMFIATSLVLIPLSMVYHRWQVYRPRNQ